MAGKSAMRGKTEAVPRSTKATKRLSVDELVAFMSLPIFYELRTAVDVGILLFDDLDEYDLPEGYSKEDIWRILLAVRKQAAVFVPEDPERNMLGGWEPKIQLRDGLLTMDEERVHELFAGAPPLTSLDQLVANYFRLSSDCDSLARRAVTHGLIETLYYELSEGVDLSELPERVLAPLDPRLAPPESQVLMDLVCQRACAAGDDMRFGPVLRLLNISWFFRYFNVLPRLNVLVGLLLRNILALKWGFPVLSWIPEGFDATLAEAPVDAARYEAVFESWSTDYGFGFDFTPYFELNVCLYLRELEGLAASITYLEQLNEQIERILESHINARQKSILAALCREPGAILRIAPHQRAFRIAYGTARADFLGLEREGYLVREQEGRAFAFRAHPDLQEKIVQLGAAVVGSAEASLDATPFVVS